MKPIRTTLAMKEFSKLKERKNWLKKADIENEDAKEVNDKNESKVYNYDNDIEKKEVRKKVQRKKTCKIIKIDQKKIQMRNLKISM